jgi:aminobenzoyl-glutamate transport protein
MSNEATVTDKPKKGMLDRIESVGNKVPHPVLMFLYLILFVAIISAVLAAFDVSVTEDIAVLGGSEESYPTEQEDDTTAPDYEIQQVTVEVRSLLSQEGIRHVFSSFVNNFAGFSVVAVTLVAMAGVGVAEAAGLMGALIRKLVKVAPARYLSFILIFVGALSSVATDAGYLILVPLGAAAFLSVGRHPLAGLSSAFAGVGAIFAVNLLITPTDSMLNEITNEAILLAGGEPITITANYYFSAASTIILSIVAAFIAERIVSKRLGTYDPSEGDPEAIAANEGHVDHDAEAKGLRYSFYGFLACMAVATLLVAPSWGPLRDPETGAILGTTPFMDSLIFIISLMFLVCGVCYGKGAGTIKNSMDVIQAVQKMFASLSGLILMLLMISQFIAYFNWTNLPRVIAIELAQLLEEWNISAVLLLVGFIFVIILLDFILPGVVPKWAIFAPVFIPIFLRLNVAPQTLLAAYRVGDSPINVVTPLMVYLPFMVTIAQRYKKDAGIGTIISLMLPFVIGIAVAWTLLFVAWFLLGIPLGPGSPVKL